MIALVATVALAAEPLSASVGVGLDMTAIRGSARHDVAAGLRLWGTTLVRPPTGEDPFGISATFEIAATPHADHTAMYTFRSLSLDSSGLAEIAFAPHATAFRAGVGPALVVRMRTFDSDVTHTAHIALEGGARARVALDGPLGKHLAWSWHMGTTMHVSGVDWDAGLGLGVAL